MFGAVDWIVVVLYVLAMLWLGFLVSKGQTSTKNYFLGNREMSWWAVGLSIIATETSALTIIGTPAMAYGTGPETGNLKFL
ncbi:MAG: sodium:solute symporter, partial [Candidatus Wallbacteria bacterium]|nr:sodium:solute symporter [Candidatus Wallbacteria bacterium]